MLLKILAMFVTLPPMIQSAMLTPRCYRWFNDLAWVRFVTFRPQKQLRKGSPVMPLVLNASRRGSYDDDSKEELLDTKGV